MTLIGPWSPTKNYLYTSSDGKFRVTVAAPTRLRARLLVRFECKAAQIEFEPEQFKKVLIL